MATDDLLYDPDILFPPTHLTARRELLFEFLRGSDRSPMVCELRFNGESYGWEAQFFVRGELFIARGGFVTRALATQWAAEERDFWLRSAEAG